MQVCPPLTSYLALVDRTIACITRPGLTGGAQEEPTPAVACFWQTSWRFIEPLLVAACGIIVRERGPIQLLSLGGHSLPSDGYKKTH